MPRLLASSGKGVLPAARQAKGPKQHLRAKSSTHVKIQVLEMYFDIKMTKCHVLQRANVLGVI
jgi:hypothetical protein